MDLASEVEVLLRGRATLLCVTSVEEERVLAKLVKVAETQRLNLYLWDHADFFQKLAGPGAAEPGAAKDPLSALESIERMEGACLFVLRDFHQCCDAKSPRVVRKLRSLAEALKYTQKSIVLIQPRSEIPEELKDLAVPIELPLPDAEELEAILAPLEQTPGVRLDLNPSQRFHLIRSALGLTANQAQRVFARAIVNDGVLDVSDIEYVASAKKDIVSAAGCALEYFLPRETIADVGGLEEIKRWLRLRARSFSPEAIQYGLPPRAASCCSASPAPASRSPPRPSPRCGRWRSCAWTPAPCSAAWSASRRRTPVAPWPSPSGSRRAFCGLTRSKRRCRRAIGTAARRCGCSAPSSRGCRSGGSRSSSSPPPTTSRACPPSYCAAGGSTDLLLGLARDGGTAGHRPGPSAQAQARCGPLRCRGAGPGQPGLRRRRIGPAIVDAMYAAFNDEQQPRRELGTADVVAAMNRLVPLSRSQSERITELRRWLDEGRARSASLPEVTATPSLGIPITPRRF